MITLTGFSGGRSAPVPAVDDTRGRRAARRALADLRCVAGVCGCVLLLFVSAVLPAAGSTAAGPSAAELDRFLAASLDRMALPRMAVAITHGLDVVYLNGLGSDGRDGRVTPRTPFRLASLSKSFTATAVLQLPEEGRVDLDSALVLAALTLAVLVIRLRLVLRLPRWAARRDGRSWWTVVRAAGRRPT